MFDSGSPAESELVSVVSSGWLRAARYSALICTIALGVGFVAEAAAHDPVQALLSFGPWGALSLALLHLLYRRGKNSQAFALGMGAPMAFIALLAVARGGLSRSSDVLRHLFFILGMIILVLPPFALTTGQSTLGALLSWLYSISSATLGLSSVVAFQKMAHEAKGMRKLRFAFGSGIFCPLVVLLIFTLLGLFFFSFRM
jgi:hypothetical protein